MWRGLAARRKFTANRGSTMEKEGSAERNKNPLRAKVHGGVSETSSGKLCQLFSSFLRGASRPKSPRVKAGERVPACRNCSRTIYGGEWRVCQQELGRIYATTVFPLDASKNRRCKGRSLPGGVKPDPGTSLLREPSKPRANRRGAAVL